MQVINMNLTTYLIFKFNLLVYYFKKIFYTHSCLFIFKLFFNLKKKLSIKPSKIYVQNKRYKKNLNLIWKKYRPHH